MEPRITIFYTTDNEVDYIVEYNYAMYYIETYTIDDDNILAIVKSNWTDNIIQGIFTFYVCGGRYDYNIIKGTNIITDIAEALCEAIVNDEIKGE